MNNFKKYSFNQKKDYWSNVLNIEFVKKKKTNINSNKLKYAVNFLSTCRSGKLSKDFYSLEYSAQLGQIRGLECYRKQKK